MPAQPGHVRAGKPLPGRQPSGHRIVGDPVSALPQTAGMHRGDRRRRQDLVPAGSVVSAAWLALVDVVARHQRQRGELVDGGGPQLDAGRGRPGRARADLRDDVELVGAVDDVTPYCSACSRTSHRTQRVTVTDRETGPSRSTVSVRPSPRLATGS